MQDDANCPVTTIQTLAEIIAFALRLKRRDIDCTRVSSTGALKLCELIAFVPTTEPQEQPVVVVFQVSRSTVSTQNRRNSGSANVGARRSFAPAPHVGLLRFCTI